MNRELWNLTVAFDLDQPLGEYGFSTRLAHENRWPTGFTAQAILEYKKFMYLAATTGSMVSPSEIVDIVWHQHLLFTKSYEAFCQLLGKRIEHIPSTHNREEQDKFEQAKKHTKAQYTAVFGLQPKAFWECRNLYEPLKLRKSRLKIRNLLAIGLVAMVGLLFPAYAFLKDFYTTIDNPDFLLQYVGICVGAVLVLELVNRNMVQVFMKGIDPEAFLFNLSPVELIYMKYQNIDDLIHISINKLIEERKIAVQRNRKLTVPKDFECANARELVVKDFVQLVIHTLYKTVVYRLRPKAVFQNTKRFTDGLRKAFVDSRLYMWIMTINLTVCGSVAGLGCVRILTGIAREKPIAILLFTWLASLVALAHFLLQTVNLLTKVAVPSFYRKEVQALPRKHNTSEWRFFLYGQEALSAVLIPLIGSELLASSSVFGSSGSSSSGCGSACGSSCGSGCGGGCGGCGS